MPRKRRSYPAELKAKPIPILGGARLSGKVSNSVTVGVLNMQTESMGQTAANNFTVARVRQDLANRSSIGGLFVNRQATGSLAGIGAGRTSVSQSVGTTGHSVRLHLRLWCPGSGHNQRIL